MLLRKLVDYAERVKDRRDDGLNAIPPVGYTKTPVKWIIPLDGEGVFSGSLIPTEGKGKKGKEYACPHRLRTSTAVRPRLLADTPEYVLGIPKADSQKKQARARECRAAFLELVEDCAARTQEPTVAAVLTFLKGMESPPPLPDGLGQSDNVTFQVDGTLPIDLPGVREFWAQYFWERVFGGEGGEEVEEGADDSSSGEQAGPQDASALSSEMECVVCGTLKMPVPRHPFQIKRLPGRPAGAALISANVDAFESYGLPKSLIAPTCKDCAEAYAKAANLLIEGEATSVSVGSCVYIFWTKEEREFSPALLLLEPEPREVKALIRSAWAGKPAAVDVDPTPFYACALTANQGRVVVRDWLETTVDEARKNLARWFVLQQMVGEYGESDAQPLPIKGYRRQSDKRWVDGLTESTVANIKRRRDVDRASPLTPSHLLHVALKGGAVPTWLLGVAVKRNIAEQDVTRPRAALIKMVILSQSTELSLEDTMTQLDANNQNPAYLCGRLMGVLEGLQRAALGDVGANVTSRFFGTASAAPASVFGNLLRSAQHHLDKLRKEKPGTDQALGRRLEEVMSGLPAFPRALTLEQQGLFSLGYFHQRAADRAAAIAHKQAGETDAGESKETDINEEGGKPDE